MEQADSESTNPNCPGLPCFIYDIKAAEQNNFMLLIQNLYVTFN